MPSSSKKTAARSKSSPQKKLRNWDGGEYVKLNRKQLKFADYNPRTIDHYAAKGLQESIKSTNGLIETVVWNSRTGNVIAGHQRLTQLDALDGSQDYEITVIKLDVDEAEERRLNILLNNPSIQGIYDIDKLFELLGPDAPYEIDLPSTGFDVTTLELMAQEAGVELPAWMVPQQEQETQEEIEELAEEIEGTLDAADDAKADEKEQEKIADFKRKKELAREKSAFDADAQVYIRTTFATSAQRNAFLGELGMPPESTYIDGIKLAERCGITLEHAPDGTDDD